MRLFIQKIVRSIFWLGVFSLTSQKHFFFNLWSTWKQDTVIGSSWKYDRHENKYIQYINQCSRNIPVRVSGFFPREISLNFFFIKWCQFLSWGGGHINDQYTNIIIVWNHPVGIMNKLDSLKLVVSENKLWFWYKA